MSNRVVVRFAIDFSGLVGFSVNMVMKHTGGYSATAASRGGVLWDPSTQQRLVGAELNRRSILR